MITIQDLTATPTVITHSDKAIHHAGGLMFVGDQDEYQEGWYVLDARARRALLDTVREANQWYLFEPDTTQPAA